MHLLNLQYSAKQTKKKSSFLRLHSILVSLHTQNMKFSSTKTTYSFIFLSEAVPQKYVQMQWNFSNYGLFGLGEAKSVMNAAAHRNQMH